MSILGSTSDVHVVGDYSDRTSCHRRVSSHRLACWCARDRRGMGLCGGSVYHNQGLTLSHYDAKGHLVVARRVFDSLTPRWRQIGAVWLPLPHLLNLLPVQVDWLYRTGASGVPISVARFGLAAYAATRIVLHATGSRSPPRSAVALVAANPNLLYLQSTPMTEPLLLGLLMLATWRLTSLGGRRHAERIARPDGRSPARALTRYEAWPFMAAAIALAALRRWRLGTPRRGRAFAVRPACAAYPTWRYLAFVIKPKHGRRVVRHRRLLRARPAYQGKVLQVDSARSGGACSSLDRRRSRIPRRSALVVRPRGAACARRARDARSSRSPWARSRRFPGTRSYEGHRSACATWCRGRRSRRRYRTGHRLVPSSRAWRAGRGGAAPDRLVTGPAVRRDRADGARGAMGRPRSHERRAVTTLPRPTRGTGRRFWRAWARSRITCRSCRRRAFRLRISCTKATAISGSAR